MELQLDGQIDHGVMKNSKTKNGNVFHESHTVIS